MSGISVVARVRTGLQRRLVQPVERSLRRVQNAGREYEPVFVVGAMGSGTTLVTFEMGHRFDVAGVIEESALQVSRRSFLRAGVVADFESVQSYAESLYPRASWSREAAVSSLQKLYREHATIDSSVIVDKGPNANLVRAGFLAECFPNARFILVFRDPVVTIEGFRRKWPLFSREPIDSSIAFFARIYGDFLAQTRALEERIVAMSYEGLVADREGTMTKLGTDLGLGPARSLRAFSERPNVPGQGIRNVERNSIRLVEDANLKAYARMTPDDANSIREALGTLHARLEERAARSRMEWEQS